MTATVTHPTTPPRLASMVKPTARKNPMRALIYGGSGIGKSTFCASAPDVVFIPTEDGLAHIDAQAFPLCKSYTDVLEYFRILSEEEHGFKTLALDSLDWLERLIHADFCQQRRVKSIEDIDYGKGYVQVMPEWRRVLECLDYLRTTKGMHIIITAHADVVQRTDPAANATFSEFAPKVHKHANALIREWCDNIFYAGIDVRAREVERGFGKKEERPVTTKERVIFTQPNPGYVAKNRFNLPEKLPLDFAALAEAAGLNIHTEAKKGKEQ